MVHIYLHALGPFDTQAADGVVIHFRRTHAERPELAGSRSEALKLAESHPSAVVDSGALDTVHGGARRRGVLLVPALGVSSWELRLKRSAGGEREVTH